MVFLTLTAACLLTSSPLSQAAGPGSRAAPVVRGVPLGGIGCGTVELLPNGRFAHATINNNWERPIESMPGCFAAVWARAGTKSVAQALSTAPEYGLPPCAPPVVDSYFPRTVMQFANTRLPVTITLRAYSPLVPQDLKNSSVPVVILVFSIKNEAHAPVEAAIAVSWENLLGVGGTSRKGAFSDRTGNTVEDLPVAAGIFGMRMASPEKQISDPEHRLVYNARGTYALLAAPTTPETVVTTAGWNALDKSPGWWPRFAANGTVDGTVKAGQEGTIQPAGVIALKISLKENETRELPFAVAWHTPRLYALSGAEYGHYYERSFSDAVEAGRYGLENRQSLLALMDEWQNRLLRSSLPGDLAHQVMNDSSALFTNTVLTRDSGLGGTKPGPCRFAMLEYDRQGVAAFGAMDRRYRLHPMLVNWFPELDQRDLGEYMSYQEGSGGLPRSVGDLENGFSTAEVTAAAKEPAVVASYIFQVARRHRWTGDQRFLDRFYPSVKHAVEFAAAQYGEGGRDLRDEKRRKELYLATFRVGEYLAGAMADKRFQEQCREWIVKVDPGFAAPAADDAHARLDGIRKLLDSAIEPPPAQDAAHPLSWYALNAETGFHVDIPAGLLMLAPVLQVKAKSLSAPLFAPTFWASLDYRTNLTSARLTFRLERVMPALPAPKQFKPPATAPDTTPAALTLKEVVLPERTDRVITDVAASVGRAPVPGTFTRREDGRLLFTFTTPLSLTVGQSLSFLLR